jgi:hypothetical protein
MVLYMIPFFQLSNVVLKMFDYFWSTFFWQRDSEKKKYRLDKWSMVFRPKIKEASVFMTFRSRTWLV